MPKVRIRRRKPPFPDWLDQQDLAVGRWETAWNKMSGRKEHVLVPMKDDEVEEIMREYRRARRYA
jgi:hypothetical protein